MTIIKGHEMRMIPVAPAIMARSSSALDAMTMFRLLNRSASHPAGAAKSSHGAVKRIALMPCMFTASRWLMVKIAKSMMACLNILSFIAPME